MTPVINRCRVHRDLSALPGLAVGAGPGPVALVHDAALDGNPGLAVCRRLLAASDAEVRVVPLHHAESLADARALAGRLTGARSVVAVGGGSLLDTTKLALALDDPLTRRIVSAPQRSGWVIGPDRPRTAPLVAVPTTLGTAAEASGIVSFVHDGQKRVFTTMALQPDAAVLDPRCTEGLPGPLLVEGCLEIILRAVGPVAGSAGPWTAVDEEALRLGADVAEVLHTVGGSGRANTGQRTRLSDLAVATQQAELLRDRQPFTVKVWFLANNLSHHLRVRKMTALANLIPAYWRHLSEGGPAAAQRVERIWAALRTHAPVALPADPADGFAAWLDALGVAPAPPATAADLEEVVRSCVRMWGAGLPMLAGLDIDDVRRLLGGLRATRPQAPAHRAGELMTPR